MSIVREGSRYFPTCDICGDRLPAEHGFYEAVDAKKAAGWRSYKDGKFGWVDACPECQEETHELGTSSIFGRDVFR